jgi:hypothetical protein
MTLRRRIDGGVILFALIMARVIGGEASAE